MIEKSIFVLHDLIIAPRKEKDILKRDQNFIHLKWY